MPLARRSNQKLKYFERK